MELQKLARRVATARISRTATDESMEGKFAAPEQQIIGHLLQWLTAKYTIEAAYRSFADRVKGPWRDSLVDHWHDHAKEERDQAYDIAMKIIGLGGDPVTTAINIPVCASSLEMFCQVLSELELKAINNGRIAVTMAGDNAPLRVFSEQIVLVDAQHLDDLRRMCASFETSVVK
ncbi:MAG TPA: ferritin-like domain-containing protein [Methylobacter sp.]